MTDFVKELIAAGYLKNIAAREQKPEPILRKPGCNCEYSRDVLLGADTFIVKTNPRCSVHGWIPLEGDD